MLYGAFTFSNSGKELAYVYSENLQHLKEYVDRTFSTLESGQIIGIWEMDEDGNFSSAQADAEVYKQK